MKLISEETEILDVSLVGGKGNHLQKLVSWKAPVPEFFILTTESFRYYLKEKKIHPRIDERFRSFFMSHPKIALRSSMISEDDVDSSFAGMFETLLDVHEGNWVESLLHIYSSVHSPRVQEYIKKKNLLVDLQMAVVAQKLVEVEKSGVIFTRSPVTPTSAIAIDAAFGMGEGVVSGHADVDHYQVTRTRELILKRINNDVEVLNDLELNLLIDKALALEKENGKPSDIEWGFRKGELYVFQIRPITRDFLPLTYFVDTNLSESYPGTVSPFTAGFVKKAYENVFKESAIIMGASSEKFRKLSPHYEQLITCVDDHLYYNLEHYYAVIRALPGGEKNIDNWHKMIGGKMSGIEIPFHDTTLAPHETFLAAFTLAKLTLLRQKTFGPFLERLEKIKADVEVETRGLKSSHDIIFYLNDLINRPLGFGLTVINDVFIMLGLGFLTKVLKKKGLEEEAVIDLLKTSDGVDSLKPLHFFNELVKELDSHFLEELDKTDLSIGSDPYSAFFEAMEKKGYKEQVRRLSGFINTFGDRSFEELKLESLPMKNNPQLLHQLLKWGSNNIALTKESSKTKTEISLSWFERKVVSFTRDSIATREATRLWRGKFYHLIRELILKLSDELRLKDSAWKNFSTLDFFSLSHDEWLEFAKGELSATDARKLMENRAGWKNKKQQFPEVIAWVESEALPGVQVSSAASSSLNGQGVSSGVVEGVALVLETPDQALESDLNNFILVTKNTDPAWVYIMSRCMGLISEKGSLLSHTAIIGRELNIPTVVGVKFATQMIRNGDRLKLDATKGTVEIL
ncbi:MAG: PEP/pyruvate-binding domain-containing protein [Bacteriovoracia bacterium]